MNRLAVRFSVQPLRRTERGAIRSARDLLFLSPFRVTSSQCRFYEEHHRFDVGHRLFLQLPFPAPA